MGLATGSVKTSHNLNCKSSALERLFAQIDQSIASEPRQSCSDDENDLNTETLLIIKTARSLKWKKENFYVTHSHIVLSF
jgi:hypothetical protein